MSEKNKSIAEALESLMWPNMAIGNKAIIKQAIDALRTEDPEQVTTDNDYDAVIAYNQAIISGLSRRSTLTLAQECELKSAKIAMDYLLRNPQPVVVPNDVFDSAYEQHLNGVFCGEDNKKAALSFLKSCYNAMLKGKCATAVNVPEDFDFEHFNDTVWFDAIISLDNIYDPVTRTLAMVARELNSKPQPAAGSTQMLQRWLNYGIAMEMTGSQLPRNLISETQALLKDIEDGKDYA